MEPQLQTTPVTQGLVQEARLSGERMLQQVLERHRKEGQYTTGATSSTLRIEDKPDGFQLVGWKYAGTYDEGRKPGGMPPVSAILAWIEAKGLTFDKPGQAEHYAYAIARSIAIKGTRRYREHADVWATPIQNMRSDLASRATKYLADAVARELLRTDLKKQ